MEFPRKANKVKLDLTGCAIWLQLCEGPDGGAEEDGLECFECQEQLRD